MKYGKSRDHNEAEIVDALQKHGALVWRLESNSEPGIPDLLVGYLGRWHAVEVKTPRGRLSPAQTEKLEACKALALKFHVVVTPDEAIAAITPVSLQD